MFSIQRLSFIILFIIGVLGCAHKVASKQETVSLSYIRLIRVAVEPVDIGAEKQTFMMIFQYPQEGADIVFGLKPFENLHLQFVFANAVFPIGAHGYQKLPSWSYLIDGFYVDAVSRSLTISLRYPCEYHVKVFGDGIVVLFQKRQ